MRSRVIHAYTLVEVMIVLVLLSTILLLISMALDIHMRQMTINRTEVEQAQLAHTILKQIEKDIISVVVALRKETLEVDTSLLAAGMTLESAEGNLAEGEDAVTESEESTEEEQMIYGSIPGIYGEYNWIQIDTTKLPRGEMYSSRQIRRGAYAVDRLSAAKTVMYYLGRDTETMALDDPQYQPEQLMGSIGRQYDTGGPLYGLFRRQIDRQAMQYAIQEGIETEYEQDDDLLAPEVAWIRFDYFDPTIDNPDTMGDWVDAWDMDERQTLPSAIRITVAIRRPNLGRSMLSFGTSAPPEPVVYSLVVIIPMSIDVPPASEEFTEEVAE